MVPDYDVAERGEECVRRALEQMSGDVGVVGGVGCGTKGGADEEKTSFADIIVGMDTGTACELGGFTFTDVLQRADMLSETILEGVVDTFEVPLC